jgi:hypothetical protein
MLTIARFAGHGAHFVQNLLLVKPKAIVADLRFALKREGKGKKSRVTYSFDL